MVGAGRDGLQLARAASSASTRAPGCCCRGRSRSLQALFSFFSNFRADRLIAQINSSTNFKGTEAQKAVAKLKDMGPGVIESILAALPDADKQATVALVDVLAALATVKTFPIFVDALVQGSPRVISGVSWALTSSHNYPPACCCRRWPSRAFRSPRFWK